MKRIILALVLAGAVSAGAADGPAETGKGPLTMEHCIATALASNPGLEAAARRIEASRAMMEQAEAAYYPWLFLQAGWARTDNPPQAFMMSLNQRQLNMADPAFNPNDPDDTENVRLTAGVKYRLYDGGRRGADRAMAAYGVEATSAARQAARNELIHQVTRGYFGVGQAQAFVKVQEETVASLEESRRVAEERLEAGSAVKTDVLNLEVRLAQSSEDLIRARNGVRLAVAALNTAIGEDLVPDTGLPVADAVPELPPFKAPGLEDIENRPELAAARIMARVKTEALRKARGLYAPSLNMIGTADWDSEEVRDFEQSYYVGVQAEWDLFTGFQRGGAVRGAAAELAAAEAEVQKARNELKLDLKQAIFEAEEAAARVEVTRKSVESAGEALRITQERYGQGAADITELLTAQVGLTALQSRRVAAYFDYLTALSNVERARGRLVEQYGGANGK